MPFRVTDRKKTLKQVQSDDLVVQHDVVQGDGLDGQQTTYKASTCSFDNPVALQMISMSTPKDFRFLADSF